MDDVANWFEMEMFNGVAKLASLSLGGRPLTPEAEETVADNFSEVLWPGIKWELHRDTPRIREGFRRLMGGDRDVDNDRDHSYASRQFPQPKDLEAAMPRAIIPESRQVEYKVDKSKSIHITKSKSIASIRKFMAGLDPVGREPFNPNWTPLQRVNWLRRRMGAPPFVSLAEWEAHVKQLKERHPVTEGVAQ